MEHIHINRTHSKSYFVAELTDTPEFYDLLDEEPKYNGQPVKVVSITIVPSTDKMRSFTIFELVNKLDKEKFKWQK